MRKLGLALTALSLAFPVSAFAASEARADEPQWIYRDPTGSEGPVAAFLDWNYQNVLLRVSCDNGELLFQFRPGGAEDDGYPMILVIDDTETPMSTERAVDAYGPVLRGRMPMGAGLAHRLAGAEHIMIGAPNEMNEAWHLGRAEPLARVAVECEAG